MWQVGRVIGISSKVNASMLQDWLFTGMYATAVKLDVPAAAAAAVKLISPRRH